MSDGNDILRLVPKPKTAAPPDEAIEMLEDIIARLRAGTVTDVSVAAVHTTTSEMLTAWYGWSGNLIAPTQLLAARLMTDLRGR